MISTRRSSHFHCQSDSIFGTILRMICLLSACRRIHSLSFMHHRHHCQWRSASHNFPSNYASTSAERLSNAMRSKRKSSSCSVASTDDVTIEAPSPWDDDRFLRQVETTVDRVLQAQCGGNTTTFDIMTLPESERQEVAIAQNLRKRLKSAIRQKDCRRCWFQKAHCICNQVQPLPLPSCINRIFLLAHHKEICLTVDTAKLILAAFPEACRLVVAGIPGRYQETMAEMLEATKNKSTLVLYPNEKARTFGELLANSVPTNAGDHPVFDVIVIDGTWEQARRLYNRYIAPETTRVQLSLASLESLAGDKHQDTEFVGRQLRRHAIPVRQIATAHALQLLLQDVEAETGYYGQCGIFGEYQQIATAAAKTQLGPPRPKQTK